MNGHRGTRRIDDASLDAALAAIVRVGPSPGLRRRVMARLGDTSRSPAATARPRLRITAPAAVVATILAVLWIAHPRDRQPSLPAAAGPAPAAAAPLRVPPGVGEPRRTAVPRGSAPVRDRRTAESWHAALPPLEPPRPLGIEPLDQPATVSEAIVIEPLAIDSLRIDTLD